MPAEGWLAAPTPSCSPTTRWSRLVGIAVEQLGVTEVRFTGGEPLLRPGLVERIVAEVAGAAAAPEHVADHQRHRPGAAARMRWPRRACDRDQRLARHAARRTGSASSTRRDRLDDVLRRPATRPGDAGLRPVKINTVLMRGVNDDEAASLLRFGLEHGYELRFIEQMPLDAAARLAARARWSPRRRSSSRSGERWLTTSTPRRAAPAAGAPAERSLVDGGPRAPWASSRRSPARSAATATAPGSPPTVRCAPACSPSTRPTCATAARGADDEEIADAVAERHVGQAAPGTRHRRRASCSRTSDERDRRLTQRS